MDCNVVAAALVAICSQLPDLPEPDPRPVFSHYLWRDTYVSYKTDKSYWNRKLDFRLFQATAAFGKTGYHDFDEIRNKKTFYLYVKQGDFSIIWMPSYDTLGVKWEFD